MFNLVGGALHALGEWAADVVEDVERGGEVDDVHAGVERMLARMTPSCGFGAMARSTRDGGNRRTSMAALAPATWNDVIECACRGIQLSVVLWPC